jgi:hypothetical protein
MYSGLVIHFFHVCHLHGIRTILIPVEIIIVHATEMFVLTDILWMCQKVVTLIWPTSATEKHIGMSGK